MGSLLSKRFQKGELLLIFHLKSFLKLLCSIVLGPKT